MPESAPWTSGFQCESSSDLADQSSTERALNARMMLSTHNLDLLGLSILNGFFSLLEQMP